MISVMCPNRRRMEAVDVRLINADEAYTDAMLDMAREFERSSEGGYQEALDDVSAYFRRLRRWAAGGDLPSHVVQENVFWLVHDGRIMGLIKLRHRLNEALLIEGGHIGYGVRPSERRKGYGTMMLRMVLEKARALGLERVLLTCDADNVASAKIIESNGGIKSGTSISPRTGKEIFQYWIEL